MLFSTADWEAELKNVSLVETVSSGKKSWRLLDQYGKPIPAFEVFAKSLEKGRINTRESYCRWLAEFFDYLYEAAFVHGAKDVDGVTHDQLIDFLESYDSYLVFGGDSGNELACLVDRTLPSPRISQTSSGSKHAALRRFLRLSERVRQQSFELAQTNTIHVAPTKLLPEVGNTRPLSRHERQHLIASSMIAGVISGGPKLIQEAVLPGVKVNSNYDHRRAC